MPDINWIGSPNFHRGRQGYKPLAIVCHVMDGTLVGTDAWFQNPKSQVSAHYGVGKDGSIHQYVQEADEAWANGIVDHPTWAVLDQHPGVNPNLYTISIEHEGHSEDGLTEAQYQSSLWLQTEIVKRWGIPIDNNHIVGHNRIDGVNRPNCPGPKFPWARLFADLDLALQTFPPDIASGYEGFVPAVKWASVNGILGHFPDGTIRPTAAISREQFAFVLQQFYVKSQKGELK